MATLTLHPGVDMPSVPLARRIRPWKLGIVLLGAVLQAIYFTGVIASDDLNYLRVAQAVRDGRPIPDELHYFVGRFAHWLPIQWSITYFPHRIWALALPCWLATLSTAALLWWAGRRWLPHALGWIPLFAYLFTPLVVLNASVAVPDPIAGLLAWAGVFLAMGPLLERNAGNAGWRCFAAGALIALGYNAKEWVLIFVPGLCLFTILSQFRQAAWWRCRRALCVALGAACWLTLEMLAFWHWAGDPLFHVHAAQQALRDAGQVVSLDARSLAGYWTEYLRWMADPTTESGAMGPILLAGMMAACLWRSAIGNLLLCCLLPALVYLSVGSSELGDYVPVCHQQRYLAPLIPGMAMLSGLMIARLVRSTRLTISPRLTVAVCAAGLIASAVVTGRFAGRWYHASTFTAGVHLLRQANIPADETVLASGLTANRFLGVADWLRLPPVEAVAVMPQSAGEWQARFAGRHVLLTGLDTRESIPAKHHKLLLSPAARASLNAFPCVGRMDTVSLYTVSAEPVAQGH